MASTGGALTPFRVRDARLPVRLRERRLPRPRHPHPDDRTVAQLAGQLVAWGPAPERSASLTVRNEAGDILDPEATIIQAGLANGDIFRVERG